MHTLFLDIASHDGFIACVSDDAVVSSMQLHTKSTDADLVGAYQEVLKQAAWDQRDLTQLACVIGPGGFTSLRVACAFVNTLSFALGIPSAGVRLDEVKVVQLELPSPRSFGPPLSQIGRGVARSAGERVGAWWLHSTKKDLVFIRGFGRFAEIQPEAEVKTLAELDVLLHAQDQWFGELIPEHEAIVSAKGAERAELRPIDDVLPELLKRLEYRSGQTLLPWYGRGW